MCLLIFIYFFLSWSVFLVFLLVRTFLGRELRAARVAAFGVDAKVRKNFASILVLYSRAGRASRRRLPLGWGPIDERRYTSQMHRVIVNAAAAAAAAIAKEQTHRHRHRHRRRAAAETETQSSCNWRSFGSLAASHSSLNIWNCGRCRSIAAALQHCWAAFVCLWFWHILCCCCKNLKKSQN